MRGRVGFSTWVSKQHASRLCCLLVNTRYGWGIRVTGALFTLRAPLSCPLLACVTLARSKKLAAAKCEADGLRNDVQQAEATTAELRSENGRAAQGLKEAQERLARAAAASAAQPASKVRTCFAHGR